MNKLIDIGLLLFRISVGAFLAFGHGLRKIEYFFSGNEIKFLDFMGIGSTASLFLAMSAEVAGSILIMLGLFTRFSSASLIITMAVAAFVAHAGDPFSGKEKSLLFLVSFILLFFTGPGKYSIQSFLSPKFDKLNGFLKFTLS